MPEPRAGRLAALAALLLAGCTAAPSRPTVAAQPEPLAPAAVEALAGLLETADRRDFDAARLAAGAAAADPRVRTRAALTLANLRDVRGLPLLAPLLADADSGVAAAAAFALGQIGDTAAVGLLEPLLAERARRARPSVAAEAAYALGKLPSAAARALLRDLLRAPVGDAQREPVGSALLALWRHPRLADPDPLARWAGSPDPELRWRATYALVRRPDPAAAPLLLRLTDDADPRVRALAFRGLVAPLVDSARLARPGVVSALAAGAADADYGARISAIRSLGTFAEPAATRALAERLASAHPHDVLAAAEALGRIGPPAAPAAGALLALAESAERPPALREAALAALAAIAPSAARAASRPLAADAGWRLRAASARALAPAGPHDPTLQRLRADADPRVAAAALAATIDAAGDSLVPLRPLLLQALSSPDVGVRAAAIAALGRLLDPAALPLLLDAYARAAADAEQDAALAAIDALAALREVGGEPQRAFFARFARPADPLLRLRARARFGAAADSAWGAPLPLETRRAPAEYAALARRYLSGAAPPRIAVATAGDTLVLRLHAADAPLTVDNLLRLAGTGYFDGQQWPRVVPNFVVQGGDPRGDTRGGPGYAIRDEINRHRYGAGTLGMALSGPDTGGSQFFVTHAPQPHLDGGYTVFGELERGHRAIERILPGDLISRIWQIQ